MQKFIGATASFDVIEALGDVKLFVDCALVEWELVLDPRLDGEDIVWKDIEVAMTEISKSNKLLIQAY